MEFQFGMNWSAFSTYVGDVFGSPLAIEGLGAFMLEATFIGLWVFGWDRLSPEGAPRDDLPRLDRDLAVRVLHPRRELVDAAPGRLRDQLADRPRARRTTSSTILFQGFVLFAWGHVILAGLLTGGLRRARRRPAGTCCAAGTSTLFRGAAKLAIVVVLPVSVRPAGLRERVRRRRHRRAADEDRRHRGALGHGAAGGVLALPDRRLHRGRPDAVVRHRDPGPALVPRHELVQRPGRRA